MKRSTEILTLDPLFPDLEVLKRAADVIRGGGVVVVPTRCLYGLAGDARDPRVISRVFRLKRRPEQNPIPVLIPHSKDLNSYAPGAAPVARMLARYFWPGKLTLVCPAASLLAPELTGGTGKIGLRVPGHPTAAALVAKVAGPVTGTSANISGNPGCHRIALLDPEIREGVDLILDAGPLEEGAGSTVLDTTVDPPKVLRHGVVTEAEIFAAIREMGPSPR